MKRLLPILLCLALLTGCSAAQAPTQPQTEPAATQPAALVSLYDSNSEIEKQTGGAVRAYPLEAGEYRMLLTMGNSILVVAADGTLTAVQGEKGEVTAAGQIDLPRDWEPHHIIASPDGVIYFARESREVVTLDPHLQQLQRSPLPEGSQGDPLLQASGEVFYRADNEIWAFKLETGISRLVRSHLYEDQTLVGSYFNDKVISCRITDDRGSEQTLYLRAENGEEIFTDGAGFHLETLGQSYFAICQAEPRQYLYGDLAGTAMCLYPTQTEVFPLLAQNGALGYGEDILSYYDLGSGKRSAQITLAGVIAAASDGEAVWLLEGNTLYRWDVTGSATHDETVYAQIRYTAENPDTEGLAACQTRVEQLRETYGLELYIWEDAAELTKDYGTQPEYRVEEIQNSLTAIEGFLAQCPEGFLKLTGSTAFYLVQSLDSGAPAAQYWQGTTSCTVFDTSRPLESFLWGLGFGVDTKVLGNSRKFDTWDDLNPKGFKYTYDHAENAQRETVEKYLTAFINQQAMSFPTEDRSHVFAYACMPDNQAYFENKTLQKKLTRVCEAIREAYDLKKSTQVFPWEQYLEEPLAKEA